MPSSPKIYDDILHEIHEYIAKYAYGPSHVYVSPDTYELLRSEEGMATLESNTYVLLIVNNTPTIVQFSPCVDNDSVLAFGKVGMT